MILQIKEAKAKEMVKEKEKCPLRDKRILAKERRATRRAIKRRATTAVVVVAIRPAAIMLDGTLE
jgi:hypothetical protein